MKPSFFLLILFTGLILRSNGQTAPQNQPNFAVPANRVAVPAVIGENVETAIQRIVGAGLVQGNIAEMQSDQPGGTVIRQAPGGNSLVNRGTRVNLYISRQTPIEIAPSDNRRALDIAQPNRRIRIPENLIQIQLVTVPPFVGQIYNRDEVTAILNRAGLQLGEAVPVINNEKTGIIINQSPAERQRVRPNTPVNITYGTAGQQITPGVPQNVIVPNYIGMEINQALSRIPNDRLTSGTQTEIRSDRPIREVIEQFPPSGDKVDPGTPVHLKFSAGAPEIQNARVPNLIGLTLNQAAEVLRKNRLFAGQLKEQVSGKRESEVLDQSPAAESEVAPGSPIDITYSVLAREEFVIVPDVTGLKIKKAIEIMEETGLPIDQVYFKISKAKEETVIRQLPTAGEKVQKGTPVSLIAARHLHIPSWIIWSVVLVALVLVERLFKWEINKVDHKTKSQNKHPELKLTVIPDKGNQTLLSAEKDNPLHGLHFRIIPDKGIQTLKTD